MKKKKGVPIMNKKRMLFFLILMGALFFGNREMNVQAATELTDDNCTISLSQNTYTYDGTAKETGVTVTYTYSSSTGIFGSTTTSKNLEEGTDYKVSYKNNTEAGTATVTITGIKDDEEEGYEGEVSTTFTIEKSDISDTDSCTVSISPDTCTYSGDAQKPEVTVTVEGDDSPIELTPDTDYTVEYSNNINAGEETAVVTVSGIGSCTGTVTKKFTIDPKSISDCTITLEQENDGTEQKLKVTVKDGDTPLKEGTDYDVSYINNTEIGTATVTITGKGNYTGTEYKTFTIEDETSLKDISSCTVTLSSSSYTYDRTAKKPVVTVMDGSTILVQDTDFTVSYENNTKVGTATVTITGKGNYTGTITKSFVITSKGTSVDKQITALEKFTVKNITLDKIHAAQKVIDAYDNLTEIEQDVVSDTNKSKLEAIRKVITDCYCGKDDGKDEVYYRYSNGTLTIIGKGKMDDYFTDYNEGTVKKMQRKIHTVLIINTEKRLPKLS
ncbi:MAG: hypothetical protein LUF92_16415 [Clostridiales bacterium]|nr:hypothetical protein [Clostridiales bacterium]